MVFESIAGIVLNKFLEKFFFGISSENIKFSLLDGKFTLSNIGIQPSLITNLNLPLELRYSFIERVEIHAPWRQQQMTVTINMSNIYVLVSDAGDNFDPRNIFIKGKETAIEAALKEFKSNMQRQNKKQYGYFERLLLNWLDNINIKIQCIHFRYENKNKNYSFGIKINQVSAKTVNQEGQHVFFNRSQANEQYVRYVLEMDFMGFYFNSKEDYFLCNKTSAEITDEFNRMSNISSQNLQNLDYEENIDTFNYIVTISLKTHLKKNIKVFESLNQTKDGQYLFQCEINLNKIECKVTHQQYYDILDLVSVFSEYQKAYQQYANQRHLLNFREKRAKEIAELLQKKRKKPNMAKKQQQMLTLHCRRYLTWVFKHAYEEILKRKFITLAIKKQITLQNLKSNKAIMRIMQKIQNDKLKYWVLLSLYFRKKFEEKVSALFRISNDRKEHFANKYIEQSEYFEPYQYQEQINKMRETSSGQFQVFLKLNVNIEYFTFEISKQSVFGVCFNIRQSEFTGLDLSLQLNSQKIFTYQTVSNRQKS